MNVLVNIPGTITGSGKIVGIASNDLPGLGKTYIVKLDDPQEAGIDAKTYPYDCIAVAEIYLVF